MKVVDDIEKLKKQYNKLRKSYGRNNAILIVLIVIILPLGVVFLNKKIELKAQETFERNKVKYSRIHEKQINAVHDCYSLIQELNILMDKRNEKDRLNTMSNYELLDSLIYTRNLIIKYFKKNKILFKTEINTKVDDLIPKLDNFILEYKKGMPPKVVYDKWLNKQQKRLSLDTLPDTPSTPGPASIYEEGKSEKIRKSIDKIIDELELEFKKIQQIEVLE